mmetsp:Transcript_10254/g.14715  ORF Transcript_10254/g.14715 Transcript_10254/m.14715 type:complete len:89 (-) Transcript_10254:131-397(-)
MEQYLKYEFKDHTSIALEYEMFLVTHPRSGPLDQVTTQMAELKAKLKKADDKAKRVESAVSTVNNKLSSLKTKITNLFKRLKVKENKK